MIRVFIPRYKQVEEVNGRPHHVYIIDVFALGKYSCLEKRYSAFHNLHKELRKAYNTPEFPPKRVRNQTPKVLEQRRKGLEQYLQVMLKFNPVPKQLLSFLGILQPEGSFESIDTLEDDSGTIHQPVLTFMKDPYIENEAHSKLPDIVIKGVIEGLYHSTPQDLK